MKNDLSKGGEDRMPENTPVGKQGVDHPQKSNFILDGLARIFLAIKPRRFIHFRRKKTNKDGSCVETEFIYRDDR